MGFSIPKLNVAGLGLSEIIPGTGDKLEAQVPPPVKTPDTIDVPPKPQEQVKKPIGFSIPKLNVAGLGLSEIIPGTGDPIPLPVIEQVQQPKKPMSGFSIPKLNVAGLGLSEIIPGTEGKPLIPDNKDAAQVRDEEQKDMVAPAPQVKKPVGFSIPKLNVAGLGLSDLRPDTPKQNDQPIH